MLPSPIQLAKAGVEHTDALITLARDCYGLACSEPRLYNQQALSTAIFSQELHIYIAHTPEGKIVAMEICEQLPHFPQTIYLKNKMTLPEYQGKGIGKQLTAYLLQQFDFSPYLALFAFSLTYTTITQGSLYRLGASMTGLLYNSYLRVDTIADSNTSHPKRSHVIMVKRLNKDPVPTLSVVPELVTLVHEIYRTLDIEITSLSHELTPPTGLSSVATLRHNEHCHTELVVNRCGSDLLCLVSKIVKPDPLEPLATCNLFLNMSDPSAAYIYYELCRIGFVFSGFMPLSSNNEYLVMYYSQSIPVPTDNLAILPEFVPLSEAFMSFAAGSISSSDEEDNVE